MKVLKDGKEFFDGEIVDVYEGKFAGNFVMEDVQGAPLSHDDLVTFMVTARVESPKFTRVKKSGVLKRSNAMKIEAVVPLTSDKARFMYDSLGVDVFGVNEGIIESDPMTITPEEDAAPVVIEDDFFSQDTPELFDDSGECEI